MKIWLGSPGAATALSGDVNVFVASPFATTSIPTLGPKRVIGANRVSSKGFQGGCARARAVATRVQMTTSDADNNDRVRISIVMLLDRVHFEASPRDPHVGNGAAEAGHEQEA